MGPAIADRMSDLLERQLAWFETLLADLAGTGNELDGEMSAAFLARRTHQDALTDSLIDEYNSLRVEWDSARDVSDADRRRVRALTAKADALCGEVRARFDECGSAADARADEVSREIDALGRGRDMLGKYRSGPPRISGNVDRQA